MKNELLDISKNLCKKYGLPDIKIEIKQVNRGRARILTNKITIPLWVLQKTKAFGYYYIIHEITHFITCNEHGQWFKDVESKILKTYDIVPHYAKAYAKALYSLKGEKLCGKYGD